MTRSPVTTHVLDTAMGRPAVGVPVELAVMAGEGIWRILASGVTDGDGRVTNLLASDHALAVGTYRMRFDTSVYFRAAGVAGFYPQVDVVFTLREPTAHYHIPLLLSPYGYSTYRGS